MCMCLREISCIRECVKERVSESMKEDSIFLDYSLLLRARVIQLSLFTTGLMNDRSHVIGACNRGRVGSSIVATVFCSGLTVR